jgi:putative tryptophan/tyrosine transport system substrate-binding protein
VSSDALFVAQQDLLFTLAVRYRVPTIHWEREEVERGGLMSYGASLTEGHLIVGNYAARILKGEKPADLPVEQATGIGLVLNLKTAKSLGIEFPTALLVRADEVIE